MSSVGRESIVPVEDGGWFAEVGSLLPPADPRVNRGFAGGRAASSFPPYANMPRFNFTGRGFFF